MSGSDFWTWDISGLEKESTEQTLTVWNPSGEKVGSETRPSSEGWSWKTGSYPDTVTALMPQTLNALMAIQQGRIKQDEESNLPSAIGR